MANGFQTGFGEKLSTDVYESIVDGSDNYFVFIGKVDPWSDEQSPDAIVDSVRGQFDGKRNAIAIKKVEPFDVIYVIPRYNWTSGTVYKKFEDDEDLSGEQYYVLVDSKRIYMCIDNNSSSTSTVKPTHTDPEIKQVGNDGYKWKYLGNISDECKGFLTTDYMPVKFVTDRTNDETSTQYNVQKSAVDGSLVRVELTGTNTATFSAAFREGESRPVSRGNTGELNRVYLDISTAPNQPSTYYNNYDIYIESGRGPEVGQKRRITGYTFTSENGPYVTVDKSFDNELYQDQTGGNPDSNQVASRYLIIPRVVVYGDGISGDVRVKVNTTGKISDVILLNRGQDYTSAEAVLITTPDTGTGPNFDIEVFESGGLGHNILKDLNATSVMITSSFDGKEQSKLSVANDIRQFGLLKNPKLNDGTNRIAGTEFPIQRTITVSKPAVIGSNYNFTNENATFKPGRILLGEESKATATIVDFNKTPYGYVELVVEDLRGSFINPDETKTEVRFTFNAATGGDSGGNYTVSENISQYTGTGGTAEGVVLSWDSTTRELEAEVTSGNFSSSGRVVGSSSGANYSSIQRVEPKGGELLKVIDPTGNYSIISLSGDSSIARIYASKNEIDRNSRNPVYDLTTHLTVQGNVDGGSPTGYTIQSDTFTKDELILQGSTTDTNRTTARVVDWIYTSGSTGELVVNSVVGRFVTGSDGSAAGFSGGNISFTDKFVTGLVQAEVIPTSGELLYIQNIRDVDRNVEQSEEIRIVLNF